jgi:hypothetical protein
LRSVVETEDNINFRHYDRQPGMASSARLSFESDSCK